MKKIFLSLALLACTSGIMAEDYKYLSVESGGNAQDITLATVQKITFTSTEVVVHTSAGEMKFPLAEMEKMSFSSTANAIDLMPLQSEKLQFVKGNIITNGKGVLRIYDMNGVLMQIARVDQEKAVVNLDSLPAGMYIANLEGNTIKISK